MSITRSKIALALLLLGLASSAHADGLSFGATPNFTGGIDFTFGGGPSGHHGGGGGGCTQGSLDFNTNCNTVYAGH